MHICVRVRVRVCARIYVYIKMWIDCDVYGLFVHSSLEAKEKHIVNK